MIFDSFNGVILEEKRKVFKSSLQNISEPGSSFLLSSLSIFFHDFSAIANGLDSSFKKDQDILVLPLDLTEFDTHEKLTQEVLKHFGKVKRELNCV